MIFVASSGIDFYYSPFQVLIELNNAIGMERTFFKKKSPNLLQ